MLNVDGAYSQSLFDLKTELDKNGILFTYNGPVTQDIIEGIGSSLRLHLEIHEASLIMIQKVFAVFVEAMQNIINYSRDRVPVESNKKSRKISSGIISIGFLNDRFYTLSGNLIDSDKVERIDSIMSKIKNMDKAELKAFYKEQRRLGPDDESKGAGLGFIDMARKASEPIAYQIIDAGNGAAFFTLKVII